MPSFATIDRQGIETQRSVYATTYNAGTDPYSDLTQWLENRLNTDWAASFNNPQGLSRDELKTAIAQELQTLAPRYKTDFSVDDSQFATQFQTKLTALFESPRSQPLTFSQLFSPLVFDDPATNKVETAAGGVANLVNAVAASVGATSASDGKTLAAILTTLRDDAVQVGISAASFDAQVRAEAGKTSVTDLSSLVVGLQDYIARDLFNAPSRNADQVRAKYEKLSSLSFSPVSLSVKIAEQLGNDLIILMEDSGQLYKDPKAKTRYTPAELVSFKKEIETFAGRLAAEAGRNRLDVGGLTATLIGRMSQFTSSPFLGADIKSLSVGTVFAERLDERVIFAYKNRALSTADKRDEVKTELQKQTSIVKVYSAFQSLLNAHLTNDSATYSHNAIGYRDLGYNSAAEFAASADFQHLKDKYGITSGTSTISFATFGTAESITIPNEISSAKDGKDDWRKRTSELATTINNKSKSYSDEVSLKTTELNDVSSRYNSAIEALNKFVQKYNSILQEILRAI